VQESCNQLFFRLDHECINLGGDTNRASVFPICFPEFPLMIARKMVP
jgi:hypothetical protein